MRRALVLDDLDRAERQVVAGKKQITEQIEFIAWLAWFDRDATGAKALLRDFERGWQGTLPIESGFTRN